MHYNKINRGNFFNMKFKKLLVLSSAALLVSCGNNLTVNKKEVSKETYVEEAEKAEKETHTFKSAKMELYYQIKDNNNNKDEKMTAEFTFGDNGFTLKDKTGDVSELAGMLTALNTTVSSTTKIGAEYAKEISAGAETHYYCDNSGFGFKLSGETKLDSEGKNKVNIQFVTEFNKFGLLTRYEALTVGNIEIAETAVTKAIKYELRTHMGFNVFYA